MVMNRSGVNTQVCHLLTTQAIFWDHTFYSMHDQEGWVLLEHSLRGNILLATWITGVAEVELIGHFITSKSYLFGIDDDNMIASVHVWGVHGFVFTT